MFEVRFDGEWKRRMRTWGVGEQYSNGTYGLE